MKRVFLSICGATIAMGITVEYGGRTIQFAEPDCYLPLDVLFLQDSTGSFWDDLPNVVNQIPDMIKAIVAAHPDSWFGVADFKDKPFSGFGIEDDYCFALDQPLSPKVEDTLNAYKRVYASGGGDLPEATYESIINSFEYKNVGWRSIGKEPGMAGARLIIMSTDAQVHFEGEPHQAAFPSSANYPYDPTVKADDPKYQCEHMRYPTADQVAAVVKQRDLQYLTILTPKDDKDVTDQWHWINEGLLEQPSSFYQYIANDSGNFIEGVLKCIAAVTKTACAVTTTPCPLTTTTTTTTTPTTTCPTTTTTTPTTTTTTTTCPITETPTTPTTTPTTTTTTTTTPTTTTTTTTCPITETPTTTPTTTTTTPTTTTTTPTTTPTTTTTTTTPTTTYPTTTTTPTTTCPITETTTTTTTTTPTTTTTTTTTTTPTTTTPTTTTPTTTFPTTETTTPTTTITPTTATHTTTTKASPCPCPCPQPCPAHCEKCCKDGVMLKVDGHPKKIEVNIAYENKKL